MWRTDVPSSSAESRNPLRNSRCRARSDRPRPRVVAAACLVLLTGLFAAACGGRRDSAPNAPGAAQDPAPTTPPQTRSAARPAAQSPAPQLTSPPAPTTNTAPTAPTPPGELVIGLVPDDSTADTAAVERGARTALELSGATGARLVVGPRGAHWGSAANAAVALVRDSHATVLLAPRDRAAAHLTAQIGTKMRVPVISTSDAASVTATGSVWVSGLLAAAPADVAADSAFETAYRRAYGAAPGAAARAGAAAVRRALTRASGTLGTGLPLGLDTPPGSVRRPAEVTSPPRAPE